MIKIKENKKYNCAGCYACYNICPKNAIQLQSDDKGFKYPVIDKNKCINCGLCNKVCPVINRKKIINTPQAYACINLNENVRKESSSGGVFSLIADVIIEKGGAVFGAQFDENFNVIHSCVENKKDLEKLRGSKYVQSEIGNTYKKAEELLKKGKMVLFTGTPCQIYGLKNYLRKEYDNLITQDIICHGVPSPKVWKKYLEYQRKENNLEDITKISFRNKENGWKDYQIEIEGKDKKIMLNHNDDLYIKAFLKDTALRDSCYKCAFKTKNRISDITLADFWGIENVNNKLYDNKGTSLVIINSEKGKNIFEQIKTKIIFCNIELDEAIYYNASMIYSALPDKKRKEFFRNLDDMDFKELVSKYTTGESQKLQYIWFKIKRKMKKIWNKSKV